MSDPRCSNRPTSIYVCCDPLTHEVRYVGKTVRKVEHRIHKHVTNSSNHHASKWFNKIGAPYYFVVEVVPAGEDWIEAEQFWIAYLKSLGARLTNSTIGGEGQCGWSMPKSTRDKIGDAHRGKVRGPLPAETCLNMSIAQTGLKRPPRRPETLILMREVQLGKKRPRTAEHQAKLTALQTGRKKGPNSKEHNEKISKGNKGQTRNEESRAKMKTAQSQPELVEKKRIARIKSNKERVWTDEMREKNRQASSNPSDEVRENMSKGQQARFEREKGPKLKYEIFKLSPEEFARISSENKNIQFDCDYEYDECEGAV